ncbi:MAG: site-2 protease family protein [Nitrospirae bacterium]|nr:MAG: site-2 protease family protein [Nitrospirota bacterium]
MPHNLTRTHIILFFLTILTTLTAGALHAGVNPLAHPEKLYKGIPFSFTLMSILMSHELAHYFASRMHHTPATLPYFIPAPSIIGTFGAFIKMRPPIFERRSLIDIGASGPIAGFIVALIAVIIGLKLSDVRPAGTVISSYYLGSSILFNMLIKVVLSIDPDTHEIILHPVAFAGWIGFFITSINLLPIGQLDGGHIAYAISNRLHRIISILLIPILLILGFSRWSGWVVWALLMMLLGTNHPPVVYPERPLDGRRKLIGLLCFIIFILTFTPTPFGIR